jgi:hypothetical protein
MFSQTQVRNDIDVVSGQCFASHPEQVWLLAEVCKVHIKIVPIQPNVKPKVQGCFVEQRLVPQSRKLRRGEERRAQNNPNEYFFIHSY